MTIRYPRHDRPTLSLHLRLFTQLISHSCGSFMICFWIFSGFSFSQKTMRPNLALITLKYLRICYQSGKTRMLKLLFLHHSFVKRDVSCKQNILELMLISMCFPKMFFKCKKKLLVVTKFKAFAY